MQDSEKPKVICHVRNALACAIRRIGPRTTSISMSMHAPRFSYKDVAGQLGEPFGCSMLATVLCLQIALTCQPGNGRESKEIRNLSSQMLQRMPNLLAGKLRSDSFIFGSFKAPFLHLKHLDLTVYKLKRLEGMHLGNLFPVLQTARIAGTRLPGILLHLDVSGCKHLAQLVLEEHIVCRLVKQPQCWVKVDLLGCDSFMMKLEKKQLHPDLSAVNEIFLHDTDVLSSWGLLATAPMPNLEVLGSLARSQRAPSRA